MKRLGFSLAFLAGLALTSCDCRQVVWHEPAPEDWGEIQFGGEGAARWEDGVLRMDVGVELTGMRLVAENLPEENLPEPPYELQFEARRVSGSDFFCGLTFPLSSREECVTFIAGGWGGATVGISSIDGRDASQNETTRYFDFENGHWYRFEVRVTEGHLRITMEGDPLIDLETTGRNLGLRRGVIEACAPFGLAAWQTEAEVRGFRWRSLAD